MRRWIIKQIRTARIWSARKLVGSYGLTVVSAAPFARAAAENLAMLDFVEKSGHLLGRAYKAGVKLRAGGLRMGRHLADAWMEAA